MTAHADLVQAIKHARCVEGHVTDDDYAERVARAILAGRSLEATIVEMRQ